MANVYVWSGASGSGTGADWTNAYTTLAAAFTAKAAGDVFFVADDHAETQATAMTMTSPGTISNPCFVYCVNRAGSVPPVSADLLATATITTTGNNAMTIAGSAVFGGITFSCGTGANSPTLTVSSSANCYQKFIACLLKIASTSGGSMVWGSAANGGSYTVLDNTKVSFGGVSSSITAASKVLWLNTASALQGSIASQLLTIPGARGIAFVADGVDLSAAGSGKTLVGVATNAQAHSYRFKNCRLNASVTVASTPTSVGGPEVSIENCDSGATNTRFEKFAYQGTETTETTIIRTGGASDGTTGQSRKIVTTANAKPALPFETMPIAIWNETTGSAITLTVEGIWGGGAVPNNDDIWMDVEYLGSSSYPLASFATCGKADLLAAGTGLSSSSETWGGSTTKFKMAVTITPQMKGPITIYVKAGKASSTFYVDPKITVT